MSSLVVNAGSERITYSGTQFEELENVGTKHLCIRTGVNANDIKKYALTTKPLNDKYSKMKMRISAGGGTRVAYIAQRYSSSTSSQIVNNNVIQTRSSNYTSSSTLSTPYRTALNTKTTTRNSQYNITTTLKTNSSTKLSTRTTTRNSGSYTYSTSTNIYNFSISVSTNSNYKMSNSGASTSSTSRQYNGNVFTGAYSKSLSYLYSSYKSDTGSAQHTNTTILKNGNVVSNVVTFTGSNTNEITRYTTTMRYHFSRSLTTSNSYKRSATNTSYGSLTNTLRVSARSGYDYLYNMTALHIVAKTSRTAKTTSRTSSSSSRASTYTSSSTLSTNSSSRTSLSTSNRVSTYTSTVGTYITQSSSSLSTKATTRVSNYTTSSSTTSSKSTITNNVNV